MRPAQARKPSALPDRRLIADSIATTGSLLPGSGCLVLTFLCGARLQMLLHLVDRQVADVLAVDHVDDVLADVLGVVADALQRPRHPQHVERAADRARIFHHERDALALDRFVLLVDQPILLRDRHRAFRIEARERIERFVHHVARPAARDA